jgi:lysophospholipase L1-like esterase
MGIIGLPIEKTGAKQVFPDPSFANRKVLLLGTSLTSRGDWTLHLQAQVAHCKVTIEKLALPGANSEWGLTALTNWLAAGNRADLVIVEFSGNDSSLLRGVSLKQSDKNHREMITLANKNGASVSMATMSPAWNTKSWVRPGQNRYHALYRIIVREYRDIPSRRVGLIDTIDMWRLIKPEKRAALIPDNLHPTDDAMKTYQVPHFRYHIETLFCPEQSSEQALG